MKNSFKLASVFAVLCSASLLGINAHAQTIDELDINQINPKLVPAFQASGSVVNFYGENYVVDAPQVCVGPSFARDCFVTLSHLSSDPGITLNIRQRVVNDALVTTVSARPDGKRYIISYEQNNAIGSALNVKNISRIYSPYF